MAKVRGAESRFLMSVDDNTLSVPALVALDGSNHTAADWLENRKLTDADGNFTASKIDTTDREAARQGFETEEVATSKSEISFTMFHNPGDPFVEYFLGAWRDKTNVPAWDADGDPTAASTSRPVSGITANWSVEARRSAPVKGMQTWQITLTAASNPVWYSITVPLAGTAVV